MYVEEIKSERGGKKYCTYLVRESFREDSKVKHRTIANISKLPKGCIEEIKQYLKGKSMQLDHSKLKLLKSKEYGASKALLSFTRLLQLDTVINPDEGRWSEYILALIVGRLIYPDNLLSLANMSSETMLWELCGHPSNVKPDANQYLYPALDHLLANQSIIQKRLAEKHAKFADAVLCFLTTADIIKEPNDLDFLGFGVHQKLNSRPVVGLWTNFEGCPWASEIVSHNLTECLAFQESIKKNLKKLKINPIVIIGDGHILTNNHIAEVNKQGYKTITSLTYHQKRNLITKNPFFLDFFSEDEPKQVLDPEDHSFRYIFCYAAVKKKNAPHGIQKSEGERLDDFYILHTDVTEDIMSISKIISAYQKLLFIEFFFKHIEIFHIDPNPTTDQLNERICQHTFLCMLTYYLQWHMHNKLQIIGHIDEEGKQNRWTFRGAIERLKAIRCQVVEIENVLLKDVKSVIDNDQKNIISSLGVSI